MRRARIYCVRDWRQRETVEALRAERERLEEEVRQLRAAVRIYTEIAQRMAVEVGRAKSCA